MKKVILLLVMFFCLELIADNPLQNCGFPVPKTDFDPRIYNCLKTDIAPIIDGQINDEAWQKADWTGSFVDIEGDLQPLPTMETKAKILWDDENLYFAAQMEEPQLWATLLQHDSVIYRDNDFEVFLDPDWDTQNYYEMEMNAFNTTWELLITQTYYEKDCHAIDGWDIAGMRTAVHLNGTLNDPQDTDTGWTLEIALPWQALEECSSHNGAPESGEMWRMNFSRVEWDLNVIDGKYQKQEKPEHNWVWSPQGIIAMHYPEMWGVLVFCEDRSQFQTEIPRLQYVDKLRKIYYIQKGYFQQHNCYATLAQLAAIPGYNNIVQGFSIFLTPNGYEALYQDENMSCTVRQDRKMTFREN
ncbi:MAG TPA: carbohydrate-binding family 9-like protein [Candidatus Cloacimonadota bacterium]|nr:carbohydrate-binding family 9-like protein [Candidatus Cloacimonadota bacterium]